MRIPLLAICLAFLAAGPVVAGDASSQLAVNVAGDQIAVVDGDENVLAIIDATARKLVRRVDMPGKPQCVTWLGESNRIAVTIYDATVSGITTHNY